MHLNGKLLKCHYHDIQTSSLKSKPNLITMSYRKGEPMFMYSGVMAKNPLLHSSR